MKKLTSVVAILTMAYGLSACAGKAQTDAPTSGESQNTTAAQQTEVSAEAGKTTLPQGTGETLVIYSNSVSDGRGDWLVERADRDGFSIQYVDVGASAAVSRLLAERNAPIADVTFGLDKITWEALKAEDMLEQYVPGWEKEIPEGFSDSDGYYHATVKEAILLAYDKNQMSEDEAPKDWLDLWTKEEYFGKYATKSKLSGGTTRNVLAGILTRYIDPEGELGISDEGWEQMRLFFGNGTPEESGVDLYGSIASDSSPIVMGQMWSSGISAREEEYGVDTGIVIPQVGVPYVVSGIAIVKNTKKLEEAKRFVEWYGSAQIQGEWAVEFTTLPVNKNAKDQANDFNRYIDTLPAQDIDWAVVSANIDMWCEKIELSYMK